MEITLTFIELFLRGLYAFAPLILTLAMAVVVLSLVVRRLEGWDVFDALYWAMITATTVGYGDIRPTRRWSKLLSVMIAFIGLIFTGIVVSLAVYAASTSLSKNADVELLETQIELVD
jgi:voltage-gated potassium channel